MTKVCTKCNIEKQLDFFYFKKSKKQFYSMCKECHLQYDKGYRDQNNNKLNSMRRDRYQNNKEYTLERNRKIRKARATEIKQLILKYKSNPCSDCNNYFPPECMDFDHKIGVIKTFNIADEIYHCKKISEVVSEINKCDLVCANCHRLRTFSRYVRKKLASKIIIRRRKVIDEVNKIKESTKCSICNKNFLACQLDFDHLQNKEMDVSQSIRKGHSFERVFEEIAKCRIVCANCHRIHTKEQRKSQQT